MLVVCPSAFLSGLRFSVLQKFQGVKSHVMRIAPTLRAMSSRSAWAWLWRQFHAAFDQGQCGLYRPFFLGSISDIFSRFWTWNGWQNAIFWPTVYARKIVEFNEKVGNVKLYAFLGAKCKGYHLHVFEEETVFRCHIANESDVMCSSGYCLCITMRLWEKSFIWCILHSNRLESHLPK